MDGSNRSVIVPRLYSPKGLTIDFQESRLYWVSYYGGTVQSSDLNGHDVKVVVLRMKGNGPFGIVGWGEYLYWTHMASKHLGMGSKSGQDTKLLYKGTDDYSQMIQIISSFVKQLGVLA